MLRTITVIILLLAATPGLSQEETEDEFTAGVLLAWCQNEYLELACLSYIRGFTTGHDLVLGYNEHLSPNPVFCLPDDFDSSQGRAAFVRTGKLIPDQALHQPPWVILSGIFRSEFPCDEGNGG